MLLFISIVACLSVHLIILTIVQPKIGEGSSKQTKCASIMYKSQILMRLLNISSIYSEQTKVFQHHKTHVY